MTTTAIQNTDDRDGQHRIMLAIDLDRDDLTEPDVVDTVIDNIRAQLAPALRERADAYLTSDIATICARHGIALDDLRARRRDLQAVRARQELCGVLHHAGWSLPRIGRLLDRDHSTVLHAVRKWEEQKVGMDNDACEVCGDTPLGRGRWCLRHFQKQADSRAETVARHRSTAAIERERTTA